MCGIAGFSGRFDPDLLGPMGSILAHRGPDDAGEWHDRASEVGLAHRRLSIIDLSPAGHQPMATADGRLQLVCNGEIYNYRELTAELTARGHRFRSRSDSEVLLHLYEEHGTDMLDRLLGIFAFAIWDARDRSLFLARDQLGVKPLYYAELPQGFLFASEIKALLTTGQVPTDLDLEAVDDHLTYLWTPAPRTILKAVRKLEPGCALLVRGGRVERKWGYYDLPYDGGRLDLPEEEAAERLREHIETAVERQMVSDVPVGAFLSGGLDSSAVVAMMRRVRPDYVPVCYSIGFGDSRDMEGSPLDLPYARRAADHLGVELREITVGPDIISNLERLLYHLDEPQADPAPINALLISEQAHQDGFKVLLSGAGGDDILSGYRRHYALGLRRTWAWLPRPARRAVAAWANSARGRSTVVRRFRRMLAYCDLDEHDWIASSFAWSTGDVRQALFAPEARATLKGREPFAPLIRSLDRVSSKEPDPLNRMLYLEGKHFLADHNLNYTDKMGMAASVEVRVPLLDLELVDFATRIPPRLKQNGRTGKYLFRRAMEPLLPKEIIYRPKTGFGAPLRRWLHRELAELTDELLSERSLARRGLFDPRAVRTLMERDRRGRIDAAYLVFAVMCIEQWCRLFIDRRPEASLHGSRR